MKFIIGKKIEMTQKYQLDGDVVPVTKVLAGPCVISQIKDDKHDGYFAVQLGFGQRKKMKKPQAGHLKNIGKNLAHLNELRLSGAATLKLGDTITASIFNTGDFVDVVGNSKGRGFQGVVKRWGFHGQNSTRGHKDQARMPGSIGAGGVQHVFKGTRMGGRMGGGRVTIKNLEIMDVDKDNNFLFIKGAIPGPNGGIVLVKGDGEMKVAEVAPEPKDAKDSDKAKVNS